MARLTAVRNLLPTMDVVSCWAAPYIAPMAFGGDRKAQFFGPVMKEFSGVLTDASVSIRIRPVNRSCLIHPSFLAQRLWLDGPKHMHLPELGRGADGASPDIVIQAVRFAALEH
jgi:hypothetical protein